MQNKNIDLYYFSGTGNTLLAAQTFAQEVEKEGFSVNFLRLESADPAAINKNNIIGLAFPVACWMTYPFVMDFINRLPSVSGTPVFMLATMGRSALGFRGTLKTILTQKGFKPSGAHLAIMPSNIFKIFNEEKNQQIRQKGLAGVIAFAHDFAAGKAEWKSENYTKKPVALFYKAATFTWKIKFLQKLFQNKLNKDKCIKCGLCAQICPVKTIRMQPAGPDFGLGCQYCMRCVSYCPAQAIKSKFIYTDTTYKATNLPYK